MSFVFKNVTKFMLKLKTYLLSLVGRFHWGKMHWSAGSQPGWPGFQPLCMNQSHTPRKVANLNLTDITSQMGVRLAWVLWIRTPQSSTHQIPIRLWSHRVLGSLQGLWASRPGLTPMTTGSEAAGSETTLRDNAHTQMKKTLRECASLLPLLLPF
jgi:hypothetical protein